MAVQAVHGLFQSVFSGNQGPGPPLNRSIQLRYGHSGRFLSVGRHLTREYGRPMSFDAELYCLTHKGLPGDVDFYRRQCRGAEQILELGMGDGRIAVPLVEDGARVWGVESHPGMLARAHQRRIELGDEARLRFNIYDGSMSAFSIGEKFDRIIVPFTGIFCLSPAERKACYAQVREHLAPYGQFVFDVYPTDLVAQIPAFDDEEFWLMSIADGPRVIEVFQRDSYRPERGQIEVTYRNVVSDSNAKSYESEYTLVHHYVVTDAWEVELKEAGFDIIGVHGDFDGGSFSDESDRLIIIAQ